MNLAEDVSPAQKMQTERFKHINVQFTEDEFL
jgi:hypothetical protein